MATAFLPILNLKTSLLKGSPVFIGNDICVKKLENAHKFYLSTSFTSQELTSLLKKGVKCIYINNINDNLSDINARQMKTSLTFFFNYMRSGAPIHLPFFFLLHDNAKYEIDTLCDYPFVSQKSYVLRKDFDRKTIEALYKATKVALSKDDFLINILDRYNLALKRNNIYDKIIDICIALESFCNSRTEVSFRFSLYNSWSSTNDPKQRVDNYELLKKLYDVRSNIIHGNRDCKEIQAIEKQLEKIFSIVGRCVFYYILFLNENNKSDWNRHLQNLIIGIEKRKFS